MLSPVPVGTINVGAWFLVYLYSGDGHPCATHNKTAPSSCDTVTWFVCSTMLGEIIPRWSACNLASGGRIREWEMEKKWNREWGQRLKNKN